MAAFDDVAFLWDPDPAGDGSAASKDTVSDTSASGVTEGTITTGTFDAITRTGRNYNDVEGSRFNAVVPVTTARSGFTMMVVVSRPTDQVEDIPISIVDKDSGVAYALFSLRGGANDDWRSVYRNTSQTENTTALAYDTSLHVLLATFSHNGTVWDIDNYLDGTLSGTHTNTSNANSDVPFDRIAIGYAADSTPFYSDDLSVFTAAVWSRVLTAGEIAEVSANPFNDGTAFGYFELA